MKIKKVIATLGAALIAAGSLTVFADTKFTDVQPGAWYHDTVIKLANQGIIRGYQDGSFQPAKTLTRAEFLTMLMTSVGNYQGKSEGGYWAQGVIDFAAGKGILDPAQFTKEYADQPIYRKEMAKLVEMSLRKLKMKFAEEVSDEVKAMIKDYPNFKDTDYAAYITGVFNRGIIKGDDQGKFNPDKKMTRAEAAVVIDQTLQYLGGGLCKPGDENCGGND